MALTVHINSNHRISFNQAIVESQTVEITPLKFTNGSESTASTLPSTRASRLARLPFELKEKIIENLDRPHDILNLILAAGLRGLESPYGASLVDPDDRKTYYWYERLRHLMIESHVLEQCQKYDTSKHAYSAALIGGLKLAAVAGCKPERRRAFAEVGREICLTAIRAADKLSAQFPLEAALYTTDFDCVKAGGPFPLALNALWTARGVGYGDVLLAILVRASNVRKRREMLNGKYAHPGGYHKCMYAFDFAISIGDTELADTLRELEEDFGSSGALSVAAWFDNVESVKWLLSTRPRGSIALAHPIPREALANDGPNSVEILRLIVEHLRSVEPSRPYRQTRPHPGPEDMQDALLRHFWLQEGGPNFRPRFPVLRNVLYLVGADGDYWSHKWAGKLLCGPTTARPPVLRTELDHEAFILSWIDASIPHWDGTKPWFTDPRDVWGIEHHAQGLPCWENPFDAERGGRCRCDALNSPFYVDRHRQRKGLRTRDAFWELWKMLLLVRIWRPVVMGPAWESPVKRDESNLRLAGAMSERGMRIGPRRLPDGGGDDDDHTSVAGLRLGLRKEEDYGGDDGKVMTGVKMKIHHFQFEPEHAWQLDLSPAQVDALLREDLDGILRTMALRPQAGEQALESWDEWVELLQKQREKQIVAVDDDSGYETDTSR